MTRVLLALVTMIFIACTDRVVETSSSAIVQASNDKIAEIRAELKNWRMFSSADRSATNGNIVVADQSADRTIEVRYDGKQWTERQKILVKTGTNVIELKNPWAGPIRRVYTAGAEKVAFEVQSTNNFTKSQIILARIDGDKFAPEFEATGSLLLANDDRTKFAYLRSNPDILSGRHSVHYLSSNHADETVLTLTEADPGSGLSFDYVWLRSDCLYIAGRASEMEPKPNPWTHDFALLYCPSDHRILNVRR